MPAFVKTDCVPLQFVKSIMAEIGTLRAKKVMAHSGT